MERKKAILIAVLINAGLLAVLFIAALSMEEERVVVSPVSPPIAQPNPVVVTPPLDEFSSLQQLQLPLHLVASKTEEPIVHLLPPVVQDPIQTPPVATVAPSTLPALVEIVVKKGDSLEKIARGCSVTVEELIALNQLTTHLLKVGQILKVPTEKRVVQAVKPIEKGGTSDYYTVKVGDNPWTIAMKHHMKVEELLRMNSLNEEKARKLKPGDRLRIR